LTTELTIALMQIIRGIPHDVVPYHHERRYALLEELQAREPKLPLEDNGTHPTE